MSKRHKFVMGALVAMFLVLLGIYFVALRSERACDVTYTKTPVGTVVEKHFQPASAGGYAHPDIEHKFIYITDTGYKFEDSNGKFFVGDKVIVTESNCGETKDE